METNGKRFVTLFPQASAVHLTKDVGMIPRVLHDGYGYDAALTCVFDSQATAEEAKSTNLKLIELKGCPKLATLGNRLGSYYRFLIEKQFIDGNAEAVDVLNLYHLNRGSLLLSEAYKRRNPGGICFLKCDMGEELLEPLESGDDPRIRWMTQHTGCVDIFSAESRMVCDRLGRLLGKTIDYIPNGFDPLSVYAGKDLVRENNFLTVSRLGTVQKNTETLVRAFSTIHGECDWNLVLIGTMEPSFKEWLDQYLLEVPSLRQRIVYRGAIHNHAELAEWYAKSKVFIMPSRWESFGLSICEAQRNGCYLILSDKVSPRDDFLDGGQLGDVVPAESSEMLAESMLRSTQSDLDANAASRWAAQHFDWEKICGRLNELIVKRSNGK